MVGGADNIRVVLQREFGGVDTQDHDALAVRSWAKEACNDIWMAARPSSATALPASITLSNGRSL